MLSMMVKQHRILSQKEELDKRPNLGISLSYSFGSCFFSLIKPNPATKGLQFFSHTFLYSACADDTTFFKEREISN